nr:hypothetical protein [uncultured Capnocytophaga sp.]
MVGKFNNNITIQGGGGNGNTPSGRIGGIPVVEVTTPQYTVKEEDMGCVFLVRNSCTLDFTNINQTAIFFFYHITDKNQRPEITCIANNKEIKEFERFYPSLYFGFLTTAVMVYNNVVYVRTISGYPE